MAKTCQQSNSAVGNPELLMLVVSSSSLRPHVISMTRFCMKPHRWDDEIPSKMALEENRIPIQEMITNFNIHRYPSSAQVRKEDPIPIPVPVPVPSSRLDTPLRRKNRPPHGVGSDNSRHRTHRPIGTPGRTSDQGSRV